MPKLVVFSLFPAALPELPLCPLPPCPRQTEPFPRWQFVCCCLQHRGERGAAVLPVPACPARPGSHSLCGGHCVLPRLGYLKRGASLPAVKINGLGLKQLLGKSLCFRAGTKYLQGLLQEQAGWSSLLYHTSLQGFGKNVKQILVHR